MELQKMGETMVKQRARVLEQHERLRFMIVMLVCDLPSFSK